MSKHTLPENVDNWRYVSAGSDFIAVYENEQRMTFVADLDENSNSRTDGPFIVRACQSYGPMLEALKGLVQECESMGRASHTMGRIDKAHAAITKAETPID